MAGTAEADGGWPEARRNPRPVGSTGFLPDNWQFGLAGRRLRAAPGAARPAPPLGRWTQRLGGVGPPPPPPPPPRPAREIFDAGDAHSILCRDRRSRNDRSCGGPVGRDRSNGLPGGGGGGHGGLRVAAGAGGGPAAAAAAQGERDQTSPEPGPPLLPPPLVLPRLPSGRPPRLPPAVAPLVPAGALRCILPFPAWGLRAARRLTRGFVGGQREARCRRSIRMNDGRLLVRGIIQRANAKNRNGRVYRRVRSPSPSPPPGGLAARPAWTQIPSPPPSFPRARCHPRRPTSTLTLGMALQEYFGTRG